MKITSVNTILLTGPCTNDPFLSEARKRRGAAFIRVETDTELVGIGETYAGYFFPESVPGIVEFFEPILVGQTFEDIDTLWQRMYHCGNFWCRTGLGLAVLSGIEAALWDLKGKAAGVPVYKLLGGAKHDRLACYATGGPSNYPKQKLADKITFYQSQGFNAVKLGVGAFEEGKQNISNVPAEASNFEAEKLSFIREQFGTDLGVMLDGHMGNSPTTWEFETASAVVSAVEPFGLTFFEEPLHYNNLDGYAALSSNGKVPIAGGEVLTGWADWQHYLGADAFNIGQLDAAFVGGLGEFMKIAQKLESMNRKIATHAWGAGPCLMQNIHCAFACANTIILEIPPAYAGLHSELIGDNLTIKDGCVLLPQAPGLGITLTEDSIARYPFQPGSGEFNDVPGKILKD